VRFFGIFLVGVVLVLAAAWHVYQSIEQAQQRMFTLCNTTRPAEPWPTVLQRTGRTFERTTGADEQPERYFTVETAMGRRFSCSIEVSSGRVLRTRFAELPR
jgi:hypothetical protein